MAAPPDPAAAFGGSVKLAGPAGQQVRLQADLDGDHSQDDIFLVKIASKLPDGVKVMKLLGSDEKGEPKQGELALAVVLHTKGKSVPYLFTGGSFFESPTWKEGKFRDMIKIKTGPQPPKDARGKSIAVFTESGADYYIHWNGKTFIASAQGDQP